jgi:hypothetical protein
VVKVSGVVFQVVMPCGLVDVYLHLGGTLVTVDKSTWHHN